MALFAVLGCKQDDIDAYKLEDSAVCFEAQSAAFSLRGMTEDTKRLDIRVTLVGPASDKDREFEVRVVAREGNTAVEGKDFKVLGAVVKAGELFGTVELEVNRLEEEVSSQTTTLEIVPGENFRAGYPALMKAIVMWSDGYVRPTYYVWRSWYRYFCHGYSRKLHEIVIGQLGEDVERYVDRRNYVEADPSLEFKMPTWWFSASRQLRDYVEKYDKEHPDAPLMHSEDYESYKSDEVGVGNGNRPETLPTVASTLVII